MFVEVFEVDQRSPCPCLTRVQACTPSAEWLLLPCWSSVSSSTCLEEVCILMKNTGTLIKFRLFLTFHKTSKTFSRRSSGKRETSWLVWKSIIHQNCPTLFKKNTFRLLFLSVPRAAQLNFLSRLFIIFYYNQLTKLYIQTSCYSVYFNVISAI